MASLHWKDEPDRHDFPAALDYLGLLFAANGVPLTIADGYHRICASYHVDEDEEVACRMVDLP